MSAYELSEAEVSDVLKEQKVVRVAFRDDESVYLIPLGFVWLHSALYGVMEFGRKTRCAEKNSAVAFQVDSSSESGIFEWRSVTGEGEFETILDDDLRTDVLGALGPIIAQAPDWWLAEQGPKVASGELKVWRITPKRMSGRRFGPSQ
jgi:nitroimidazol reductase NimA-like FMN-containing flavoprotein (pyridoxamine 5'-phosphate oxidase superfamily)